MEGNGIVIVYDCLEPVGEIHQEDLQDGVRNGNNHPYELDQFYHLQLKNSVGIVLMAMTDRYPGVPNPGKAIH